MSDKKTFKEKWKERVHQLEPFFNALFAVVLIGYILPAGVSLVINFWKLVMFGSWTMSEFKKELSGFMFAPVNNFYKGIWLWLTEFINRLNK